MTDKFPFAFDLGAMTEAFKTPVFDMTAFQETQQKNMTALVDANKKALSGYQDIYKRQQELLNDAMAEAKTAASDLQGQPMTMDTATQNFETMKTAFEKAVSEVKSVADMAQSANMEAFEILKTRGEEILAEMRTASEKAIN